ncbi:MAG: ion channel [Steroidobacteraceae bacterium]
MRTHRHSERRLSLGGRQIVTEGLERRVWQDLYHLFMTASWRALFASFAGFFLLFNLVFALLYQLQPAGIANVNPAGYWGLFFFSVETLATVGYGDMHPQSVYAHTLAAIEIFMGMMSVGVIAGVMFSRFSRPIARFVFAEHVVIRPFDGRQTLILRAANARQNVVMEAQAQLRLIRDERTLEDTPIRRIHDLPLRRSQHPIFIFGWTLMHVIDESSPLYGETRESLQKVRANLLLSLYGMDETTGQTLMARMHYPLEALRWNHTFADILTQLPDGRDHFDYRKFHDVEPLPDE